MIMLADPHDHKVAAVWVLSAACHDYHCHCRIALVFWLQLLLLLWCSGCTWREGRGDNNIDRERVDVVVGDKVLLEERTKDNELDCSCNQSKHKIDR